jgi:hypothetical protein
MKTVVSGLALVIAFTVVSCKKNHDVVSSEVKNDTAATYARDIYLWHNNIPTTFDAHNFPDPNAVMEGIRPLVKSPGLPYPLIAGALPY